MAKSFGIHLRRGNNYMNRDNFEEARLDDTDFTGAEMTGVEE